MKPISLERYGPIISDKVVGEAIYSEIKDVLKTDNISIDLGDIKSMATFNAKQIFGRLYVELGSAAFFDKIELVNVSQDLKLIIKMGIQSALDEETAST